jgi:archaemetzincin
MIGKRTIIIAGVVLIGWISAYALLKLYCHRKDGVELDLTLPDEYARLQPLFTKTVSPQSGEWLAAHIERGQTYQEFMHSTFLTAAPPGAVIYVQPLGDFSPEQKAIIAQAAEFIGDYFSLPTKLLVSVPVGSIPDAARRPRDSKYGEQVATPYFIENVLEPQRPKDAYIVLGFVTVDLWPGTVGNYVFGQATEENRIAVCSLARICPDNLLAEDRALCLRRTLKTSTHEIGHLFALMHCPWYSCNEAGCNGLAEMDRHTLELCPQCLAKLCYATGANPAERYEKLIAFYSQNGLPEEEAFCRKLLAALQAK